MATESPSRLLILWTSGDKDTALHMVLMYTVNARLRGWWDEITLLVWGGASRLTAEDAEVQAQVAVAQREGVRVIACISCARNLGVAEPLQQLGIEVFPTGQFLTDWLQLGERVLTI